MFDFLRRFFTTKASIPTSSSRTFSSTTGILPPAYTTQDYLSAYSTVGWWHAVVFRIALGLSEVKWTLFDVSNREKPKQIYEHPILDLLHLCNHFQTSEELIALDTIYMESLGESFWVLNPNRNGEPTEIVLPYPQIMSVVPAKDFPFVKGYVYGVGANAVPLDVDEVIHFKYPNPLNQYRGLGQAEPIGINLSAERNADKWVDQFFYNSARPDGVIQFDYTLSNEQFEKLKTQWAEKYRGVSKAHQVALLEGGGKYIQIQNSVKDMDFPNLKQKNRDMILGVEGMPLSLMGITENVNKANAEAGDYTFARWVLKPRLDWKKAKLQEQLIPKFQNSKNLKLGFEEIVPETAEQRRLDAESGMRAGYWTINEGRIATGKDPLPGDVGDVLLLPLNLIPTPIKSQPKPPPTEQPEEPTEMAFKGYTSEQKVEIWNRFAQKTLRQEEAFRRVFGHIFDEQKKSITDAFEKAGQLPNDLNDEQTAKRFEPTIEMVYASGFEDALPKQADLLDEHALEWIATRSLLLAKSINATTLLSLRKQLEIGFAAGESIQQLTKRIEGYFTSNAKYRAEMVSRSEVIAASNEGALYRYEQAGVEKAEWLTSRDGQVCPECDPMDGQQIPVKEASGKIPLHPQCRCTWLAVL